MKCTKCGETREAEFYPSNLHRCKACVNAITKLWKRENPERWRKYIREYMRNHPKYGKKAFRKWYKNNADKHYERRLAYARADPQRNRAQCYAFKAFPNAQVCGIEGCTELGERHHNDYNQPYEIRWLCRKHHKLLHRIVINP